MLIIYLFLDKVYHSGLLSKKNYLGQLRLVFINKENIFSEQKKKHYFLGNRRKIDFFTVENFCYYCG